MDYEKWIKHFVVLPDQAMLDIAEQGIVYALNCLREMGAPEALVTLVDQSKWLYELAGREGVVLEDERGAYAADAIGVIFESVYALDGQLPTECFHYCPSDDDVLKCNPKSDYPSKVLAQKMRGNDGSNSDLPESS